ncbi:hypothetical protein GBF38_014792 [Xyrichtys novacula]|uniref:Peptidase C76 domain-containing protein n=1 Tax=Xyrichtys novacula TaxID=13765 RepID=A0AAV1FAT7_XYRNO|nr:hypothetical protein GBF38_014792 [Xyrichtys novacula]
MPRKSKKSQVASQRWQRLHDIDRVKADGVPQSSGESVSGSSRVRNVNSVNQSGEQNVCASRSQASLKYGQSRNQQCTCNSLTFLAFLYENEHITRADLDRVLDKGDVMYREIRKTVDHAHLTTDELPNQVPARRHMQTVDMLQLSRYGTFGDPDPGAVDTFLDLISGLSCLLTDVQYALLLMTSLCIAVFRTRDGRYGFFDPHARTANGLPLLKATPTPGTAVMVTFTRLSDMIHRLIRYHHILGTAESCRYELKPVVFCDVNPSDVIPATESPSTSPSTQSNLTQPLITIPVASDKVIHDISTKLSKLNKQQKKKFKRRLMRSEKTSQKKKDKNKKEREKYAKNETYKAKKKSYSSKNYSVNPEIQTKKRKEITTKYRESTDFRLKQKDYITKKYRENVEFKGRQKEYFTKKYKENVEFKGRQKEYITRKYRENVDFKGRKKDYFRKKYSVDINFRQRKRSYVNHRYANDEIFHDRHRQLMRQMMRDRQTMITRPVGDDEESERLKRAKEKLAPLNQLLNETQTESMSFQQLLSVCDLTADEYEKHMNVMSQSSNIILKHSVKMSKRMYRITADNQMLLQRPES